MKINIERDSKIPLYVQIKNQIRNMIYSKIIPVDYMLPSKRELAKILDINRSTVVKSYQELEAEGLISSEVGKVNTLSQNMICEFLREGYYAKYLKMIRIEYCLKRNLMIKELEKNFKEIEIYKPQDGFYLWCKFSNEIDIKVLLKKSIINEVNFISGNFFSIKDKEETRFIRLNFTYPKNEEIIIGIKRLRKSLGEMIQT